ncbi:hypothetical protein D9619_008892 [Psilocybe cf. subviscida]|uniref:Uncharacterized protein n=1 Tax=Psilocybe cf. subviscida TaxID=2480587 RepID=A0A8H5B9N0_9AGAR|nr:hypothetical protein D9619_008892 [Psilocybe cf. subviscida]
MYEGLQNEINIYLLSLGPNISAFKLMEFLQTDEIKNKHGIDRNITERTARRYLHELGYRYKATPKGQYADGHERYDMVSYCQNVFLPEWQRLMDRMASWGKDQCEVPPQESDGQRVVTWFHDESIFYAND